MGRQRSGAGLETDIEALDSEVALEPFLDAMEKQNKARPVSQSSRTRIEDLLEERQLRKQIDDFPDWE
jgi:hypothetical protein